MSEPTTPVLAPRVEDLTPRHREVLQLLAKGKTNFEIAEVLGISLEGAKYHVREIMGRLGVDSREDAAAWFRAQRRPAARARRGLGWFLPRLAVVGAIAFAAMLAFVTVAVGMGIGGFTGGGKPAAAFVPICGEGDVALAVESELRDGSQSRNGDPEVLIRVRIATNNVECYLGGKLTIGREPFDWVNSRIFPASVPLDAILGSQEASVSATSPQNPVHTACPRSLSHCHPLLSPPPPRPATSPYARAPTVRAATGMERCTAHSPQPPGSAYAAAPASHADTSP